MPARVAAAWRHGNTLIVSCPSAHGGQYLVLAEVRDGRLVVEHSCPASAFGRTCWHAEAAREAFGNWRWWEPVPPVTPVVHAVVLKPEWEQIPVPGTELEGVEWYGEHTA